MPPAPLHAVRIDKWLWAARFFKTRSLASTACSAGHIKLAGHSTKASKLLRIGERLEIKTPGGEHIVEVILLADKRGSATIAQTLYIDHTPPPPPRELSPQALRERGVGRPSKRDLRKISKLRGY